MDGESLSSQTIAVVDDEPAVRRLIKLYLEHDGYRTEEFPTAEELLDGLSAAKPNAVILDIGLPGVSGIEATRVVREWSQVPILIISVKDNEESIVKALDAGANDYLVKPFSLSELGARLRAALRTSRRDGEEKQQVATADVTIDLGSRQVLVYGRPVAVTPTEYEVLALLTRNAGRVVTHRQLLKEVWGITHHDDSHVVRVTVSNLRTKLGKEAGHKLIVNEPRVGYRLVLEPPSRPTLPEAHSGRLQFQLDAAQIQKELSRVVAAHVDLFRRIYRQPSRTEEDDQEAASLMEKATFLRKEWEALEPPEPLRALWQRMGYLLLYLEGLLGETSFVGSLPDEVRNDETSRLQSVLVAHLDLMNRVEKELLQRATELRRT